MHRAGPGGDVTGYRRLARDASSRTPQRHMRPGIVTGTQVPGVGMGEGVLPTAGQAPALRDKQVALHGSCCHNHVPLQHCAA
ncbi:hypothetical protein NDU88_001193 [Pleurodeles waltl]|uniref:Uncharacterized protein n=1 Tax=Pleurodeles waltl TaxID=8319 RepID=A0AAV7R6C3_PLEWA|nr:hypothetical protein NDU88_001193 [Pleurodeles waltl]